jgi:anti-sigma factor RsiW
MSACADFEPRLAERATGPLDPADARELDAHLSGCVACRAELVAFQQAFDLARLPPPAEPEWRALADLPRQSLRELKRDRVGTPIWRAFAAGFAAAAAIAAVITASTQEPTYPPPPAPEPVASASSPWRAPDPDELLAAVGGGELVATAETGETSELAHAELLADAAYGSAVSEEE